MARILSLDDAPDILRIYDLLLEMEGHQSRYTTNAHDALSILQQEPVDLFIQDILRPTMNGFELYWLMKSDIELCSIPILIISAWQPVVVTRFNLGGNLHKQLRRVEFIVADPEYQQAVDAVSNLETANVLYVEGYLEKPIRPQQFLSAIKEIFQECETSPMNEAERLRWQEQIWALATQNVDRPDEAQDTLKAWNKRVQAPQRNKPARNGD